MKKKKNIIISYLFLTVISMFVLFPLIYMFDASLKTNEEIFTQSFQWITSNMSWNNYKNTLDNTNILTYLRNSVTVAVTATLLNVIVSMAAGYGIVKVWRCKWCGLRYIIILLLMIPTQALIFPLFMLAARTNISDTLYALIIPGIVSPFSVFFMIQYFTSFPEDILDAAHLDGAGEWYIFLHIVFPYAQSAVIALAIFNFVFNWNNFLWPFIILKNPEFYTVPIGITQIAKTERIPYGTIMAAAMMVSIPVIIVYFILQDKIIKGVMLRYNEHII